MKIYFIRHGETDWNKVRKLQGKSDIPLNASGIHLAEETGKGLKGIQFDAAYTSPLTRAKETARLVLGDRKVTLIEDERLEEMGFGIYEGLCCKEDHLEIPDPEFLNFFHAPEKYHAPEGGETFAELLRRTGDFLESLKKEEFEAKQTILVSTHGAALCAILSHIKGHTLSQFWGKGVQKNCAVTIAVLENGEYRIEEEGITYYQDEVKPW